MLAFSQDTSAMWVVLGSFGCFVFKCCITMKYKFYTRKSGAVLSIRHFLQIRLALVLPL
jgi:hypothetical protein